MVIAAEIVGVAVATNNIGNQGPSQIFGPRKTGPQQSAPLEQYGHEGIRGFLMRAGKPKTPRSFTSQVMSGVKQGVKD